MRILQGILACFLPAFLAWQEAFCANLPENVSFDKVPSEILPSNAVRKLFQDSEGYIWIPTYSGLARFDGSGTVIYNTAEAGWEMSSSIVNAVVEGEDGMLFVGTDKGVLRLDRSTGSIVPCPETARYNITSFLSIPGRGIWAGGDKGLLFKASGEEAFIPVRLNDGDRPILAITTISSGKDGILWLCSFQCGLVRYNYLTGKTRPFMSSKRLCAVFLCKCLNSLNLIKS